MNLWHVAIRKCSLIIYPFFVFFIFCAQDIIIFMFKPEYKNAAWPFSIYLLLLPIRVAVYGGVLRAFGKTKPVAVAAVIGLSVNIVVSFVLVLAGRGTMLAFIGPSIGALVASLASWVYLLRQICCISNTSIAKVMPWKELGQIMSLCLASGLIIFLLPLNTFSLLSRLLIQAVIFSATFLFLSLKTGILKKDEIEVLLMPVKWLRNQFVNR